MITLQSSLYAVAVTSCLFYMLVVDSREGHGPRRTYRYLILYLLLESGGFVLEWLMLQPSSPGKSLWLGMLMASSFLVAPCLWLFAREITEGAPPSLRSLPPGHVAIIATGAALTLPIIQRSYWGPFFGNPEDVATPAHLLFIHGTMILCAMLFLVQVPYYLQACLRILTRHMNQSKALLSTIDLRSLSALRLLILVVFTNWIVSLFRVLHCMLLGVDTGWGIVFALLEVGITVAIVFMLARRTTAFSIEDRQLARDLFETPAGDAPPTKYAKSSLDEPTRARIRRKVNESAASNLHLNSRLTLRMLCLHIRENPHYVSQVLNQDLGINFYDLINRQRIESAKAALAAFPDKTILDIALEVGFNSKSTFNAAFRQHAGMTPTEFRQQNGDGGN
ncbi:helix-turn-helix domain-containing protein [Pseudoxanthomonas wuyuanensis]